MTISRAKSVYIVSGVNCSQRYTEHLRWASSAALEVKSQVTRCDTYEHLWKAKAHKDWLVCPRITGQNGERGCARRLEFPAPAPTGDLRASKESLISCSPGAETTENQTQARSVIGYTTRESKLNPPPRRASAAVEREQTGKEGGSMNWDGDGGKTLMKMGTLSP